VHPRPRLNVFGRQLLIDRLEAGWSASAAAESAGVSRATAYKWWRRYRAEGRGGLEDRSCRPHRSPGRMAAELEALVLELRQSRKLGPHRLGAVVGVPRSTVYKVLRRHNLHRLDWLDRPTGRLIRRIEVATVGELVHLDVKKLGRIPDGGGHRVHGRRSRPSPGQGKGPGYDYVHSAIDACSRLAYSEVLLDESGATSSAFLRRAADWFAGYGIRIQSLVTDNAMAYRLSAQFRDTVGDLGVSHRRTPPYTPQLNGKVERFHRTLLEEWAYIQPYNGNSERTALLSAWLHSYNFHRTHTALGGRPPISRVNDLRGNYS
jgi:transposase InsO family protein